LSEPELGRFVSELAEGPPGPAAGSAAAVTVALTAALVEMAARRSGAPEQAVRAAQLRDLALTLAEADAEAYTQVLRAVGQDRQAALDHATEVPLQIAAAARGARDLAESVLGRCKASVRSDLRAARDLAGTAARVASELADVNLGQGPGAEAGWALGRRARLSFGEVAWDVSGAGPPVVLIHGTPTWSYLWRKIAPVLARDFTVYVFDLPGYGDSPAPRDGDVSITMHAKAVVELLELWNLDSPAAAAHDIGAAALLRAHLLHGRQFGRIALLDGVVFAPWITPTTRHIQSHADVYRTMPPHIFERVTAAHLRTAVHRGFTDEAFTAYHDRWTGEAGQAAYLEKVVRFDEEHTREFEPLLATIDAPVLVVWGENDAWLDPELARRLVDSIPGAELALIEDAGHFVTEDAPAEVGRALREFFRYADP